MKFHRRGTGQAGSLSAEIHEVALGLGSNLGNSGKILQTAWHQLQNHPEIFPVALSSPYRSRPVGMVSANSFVNAAALVRTTLSPLALLQDLQAIEACNGRVRPVGARGYQDRTLDLDILLYDDRIVHASPLVLPHPRMQHRLFVLTPLCEIAGNCFHPLLKKQVRELLEDLLENIDKQEVEKISWPD